MQFNAISKFLDRLILEAYGICMGNKWDLCKKHKLWDPHTFYINPIWDPCLPHLHFLYDSSVGSPYQAHTEAHINPYGSHIQVLSGSSFLISNSSSRQITTVSATTGVFDTPFLSSKLNASASITVCKNLLAELLQQHCHDQIFLSLPFSPDTCFYLCLCRGINSLVPH